MPSRSLPPPGDKRPGASEFPQRAWPERLVAAAVVIWYPRGGNRLRRRGDRSSSALLFGPGSSGPTVSATSSKFHWLQWTSLASTIYMKPDAAASLEVLCDLAEKCKVMGGVFTLLWHNHSVANYPKHTAAYLSLLDKLAGAPRFDWQAFGRLPSSSQSENSEKGLSASITEERALSPLSPLLGSRGP